MGKLALHVFEVAYEVFHGGLFKNAPGGASREQLYQRLFESQTSERRGRSVTAALGSLEDSVHAVSSPLPLLRRRPVDDVEPHRSFVHTLW